MPLDDAERIALSLTPRDRLAVVAWAYETLRENWRQSGSYRGLLDLLGLEKLKEFHAYRVLMAAGALDLNNALYDVDPDRPANDPEADRTST